MSVCPCNISQLVIHAEGSDVPHVLTGVWCPCLPLVECGTCHRTLVELGDASDARASLPVPVTQPLHVFPAWQLTEDQLPLKE